MPSVKEVRGVEDAHSPQPAYFLKLRTIALGCITFLSFLWIILFCIIIFLQWDLVDHVERSLILIMLFLDTFTLIMLPILLTRPFRPWLDAARVIFIILTHGGIAILFAVKSATFKCFPSETSANQETVCKSLIIYLNIFSWLIPVLAIVYGVGLAILMRNISKQSRKSDPTGDVEKHLSSPSSTDEHYTPTSTQSHESTLRKHLTLDSMVEVPKETRASTDALNKEKLKRHLTCDSIYEVPQTPAQAQALFGPGPTAAALPVQPPPIYVTPPAAARNPRAHDSYQSQYTVSSYYGPSTQSVKTRNSLAASSRRVPVPSFRESVPPTPTTRRMTNAHQSFQSYYTLNSTHEAQQYAYAV